MPWMGRNLKTHYNTLKKRLNVARVNFNKFPFIKRTFSSWVDFILLNDLKWCTQIWVFWGNSNLMKNNIYQKYTKRTFSLSLSNIQSDNCAWYWWLQWPRPVWIRTAFLFGSVQITRSSAIKIQWYLLSLETQLNDSC